MYGFLLILMIVPIIIVAFKAGYRKANDDAEPKDLQDCGTPIYEQMALDYPETFMFMKSKEIQNQTRALQIKYFKEFKNV